nr:MAG TPA: hypothetical protein [Bacteriophage sp.]
MGNKFTHIYCLLYFFTNLDTLAHISMVHIFFINLDTFTQFLIQSCPLAQTV